MNIVLRVVALTAIYLLVLTSVHPGDVLTGVVLAVALVAAGRRIQPLGPPPSEPWHGGSPGCLRSSVGRWSSSFGAPGHCLWCLNPRRSAPGLVTVPIPPCPPTSAAAWGVRVGITPDTVVVEIDEERGRMLLHVIDARDPDAVRAGQLDSYRRHQRRVFP